MYPDGHWRGDEQESLLSHSRVIASPHMADVMMEEAGSTNGCNVLVGIIVNELPRVTSRSMTVKEMGMLVNSSWISAIQPFKAYGGDQG